MFFVFTDPAPTTIYTLSLHDALPICADTQLLSAITPARAYALAALQAAVRRPMLLIVGRPSEARVYANELRAWTADPDRSEEHTSELQSRGHLVCRLLLEKKKIDNSN